MSYETPEISSEKLKALYKKLSVQNVRYEIFYQQYSEKLWSMAKPVDLSNIPSICL